MELEINSLETLLGESFQMIGHVLLLFYGTLICFKIKDWIIESHLIILPFLIYIVFILLVALCLWFLFLISYRMCTLANEVRVYRLWSLCLPDITFRKSQDSLETLCSVITLYENYHIVQNFHFDKFYRNICFGLLLDFQLVGWYYRQF